ncbi:MAG: chromate reductase [Glaciecola sp.]|jgi:chromate reductase
MKKIIAFSGSNSINSINQKLVQIAASYVSDKNIEVEILNLRDYPAVVFGTEEESVNGFPESMIAFHAKMLEADGYLVSTPEHNGSYPAVLKNTLDWLSRMGGKTFNDKPAVLLATSPGARGGASILTHLLAIMPYQGAKVIGGHGLGSFHDKVLDGQLVPGEDKEKIQELINELSKAVA